MIIIISSFTSQISAKAKEPCGLLLWCHLGNLLAGSDHSERSVCNQLELSLVQLWQLNNLLLHKYKSQHPLAPRPGRPIWTKLYQKSGKYSRANCHPPRAQQFLVYLTLAEWVGTSGKFITSLAALHRLALFLLGPTKLMAELSRFLF